MTKKNAQILLKTCLGIYSCMGVASLLFGLKVLLFEHRLCVSLICGVLIIPLVALFWKIMFEKSKRVPVSFKVIPNTNYETSIIHSQRQQILQMQQQINMMADLSFRAAALQTPNIVLMNPKDLGFLGSPTTSPLTTSFYDEKNKSLPKDKIQPTEPKKVTNSISSLSIDE